MMGHRHRPEGHRHRPEETPDRGPQNLAQIIAPPGAKIAMERKMSQEQYLCEQVVMHAVVIGARAHTPYFIGAPRSLNHPPRSSQVMAPTCLPGPLSLNYLDSLRAKKNKYGNFTE